MPNHGFVLPLGACLTMRPCLAWLNVGLLMTLPLAAHAAHYDRPINIITSNYDLVDTTYIDRGRLDGVKVGDKFQVKFPDGKVATQVMVTGVFDRMAAVKVVDSWLLKNGQLANFKQRPMVVALEGNARRPSPDIHISPAKPLPAPVAAPGSPAAPDAAKPSGTEMPPAAPGGVPPAAANPADQGLPAGPGAAGDQGLPAGPGAPSAPTTEAPGAPAAPSMPGAAPAAPAAPGAPDAGLPTAAAPDAGLPTAAAPDAGLPGAPGPANPDVPGAPASPAPGDTGLPPAPADPNIPPPPM